VLTDDSSTHVSLDQGSEGSDGRRQELTCQSCGAPLEAEDEYCPECGAELQAGRELRHRRWILLGVAAAVFIAAVAAATTFGVLWRNETSSRDESRASLQIASTQAAEATAAAKRLRVELAGTQLQLEQMKRLASGHGDVLEQTGRVVDGVDPLLSNVDGLQQLTQRIQTSRDRFADSAGAAVDALIDFSNAILDAQASGEQLDEEWVDAQIDEINGLLDVAGNQYKSLAAADAAYAKASDRFELSANEFSQAVRQLRKQLHAVVGK
jgi:hypothetical protein